MIVEMGNELFFFQPTPLHPTDGDFRTPVLWPNQHRKWKCFCTTHNACIERTRKPARLPVKGAKCPLNSEEIKWNFKVQSLTKKPQINYFQGKKRTNVGKTIANSCAANPERESLSNCSMKERNTNNLQFFPMSGICLPDKRITVESSSNHLNIFQVVQGLQKISTTPNTICSEILCSCKI